MTKFGKPLKLLEPAKLNTNMASDIDVCIHVASSKLTFSPTELQRKALKSFLLKKDTFVCLPTGYGKSFIYQLSLLTAKEMATCGKGIESPIIVVVSPLNSLMSDQIQSCESLGLSVVKLESNLAECTSKDMVYVSPEKLDELTTKKWLSDLGNRLIGVVIDESHCVVTWGTSNQQGTPFREAYGKIGNIRGFTKAPMLCLTATAGSKMRSCIIKSLMMRNPTIIQLSPEKTNIKIVVEKAGKDEIEKTFSWLVNELETFKQNTKKTIIYCRSLAACGEIYSIFDEHLSKSTFELADPLFAMYHSKTPNDIQSRVLKSFSKSDGTTRIVIATSALGMGVNISHVERVVHYGVPKEMEEYVQEIGRCGRDGRKSVAILYYKSYHLAHCDTAMREYIKNTKECRKKMITNYFKEKKQRNELQHECCDICQQKCNCKMDSCKQYPVPPVPAGNHKRCVLSRSVDDNDKLLLKEVLMDMKNADITSELIDDIITQCHVIFSVSDLMNNFNIFSRQTALDILALFNDIFNDIEECELLLSEDMSAYFDDDPLLMTVDFDISSGNSESEGEP